MHRVLPPAQVLAGYAMGIFPMGLPDGRVEWFFPDPRCIFEFDRFHVPRSVRQLVRRRAFEIRHDTAFAEVIAGCADRPEGTWITPVIRETYIRLHRLGFAHSVEAWQDGRLAGGLYGVALGGAFFGESMFHRVSNASKVALVALIEHLQRRGFVLVDTQWSTPHLARFGAIEIPASQYTARLHEALRLPCRF